MKANIYNNGHSSKISVKVDGRTFTRKLEIDDLNDYLNKKVTVNELAIKYFTDIKL